MPDAGAVSRRAAIASGVASLVAASGCGPRKSRDPNTLRIVLTSDIVTFDPALCNNTIDGQVQSNVFEGLVGFDSQNRLRHVLAESHSVSRDGLTYTFTLRRGVRFHNGREVTSADVRYSVDRCLHPTTGSPTAVNYFDGLIGAKDVAAGRADHASGIETPDPYTVMFHIDRPRAYFPGMLTYPTGFVVCRESVESNGGRIDAQHMVGTGPYMVTSYRPGQGLVMKAFTRHRDGAPRMPTIEWPVVLQPETAYQNFVTGAVDVTAAAMARCAEDRAAHRLQDAYHLYRQATVFFVAMNSTLRPEFARREVRRAFAMAIDRRTIADTAYKGVAQLADGVLPAGLACAGPTPKPLPYDPMAARASLAAGGFPAGRSFPDLAITFYNNNPAVAAASQILSNNLRTNLGISVALNPMEPGQVIDGYYKNKLEFFYAGWVADYPDAQDFLSTLFMSNASLNKYHWSDPRFDALCRAADADPNPERRAALYGRANQILVDEAAVIPTVFPPSVVLVSPTIRGYGANLCSYLPCNQVSRVRT